MSSVQPTNQDSNIDVKKSHRIVVGFDGSKASLRALEWATRQAEFTDASLEIVAAWEWPTGFGWRVIRRKYSSRSRLVRNSLLLAVGVTGNFWEC